MASTPGPDQRDFSPDGATPRRPWPSRLDPTSVDLTDLDLVRAVRQANTATAAARESLTGRAVDLARDATYVTVGLSLLTFQRVQVRRRELERAMRR